MVTRRCISVDRETVSIRENNTTQEEMWGDSGQEARRLVHWDGGENRKAAVLCGEPPKPGRVVGPD